MKYLLLRQTSTLGLMAALGLVAGCATEIEESEQATTSSALVSAGGMDATFVAHSVWNEGYCGEVILTNHHPSATATTWKVAVNLGQSTIQSSWSANRLGATGVATFSPMSWNSTLTPGSSTRFGFCASTTKPGATASVTEVTDDLPGSTCVEGTVGTVPTRVQMRVSNVDDYVYLTVNGLRSKTWNYGGAQQGEYVDVTPWFVNGKNEVRIQAMNGGGPVNYSVDLLVDGNPVVSETCPTAICNSSTNQSSGIWLDKTVNIPLSGLPSAQTVTLTSTTSGPVYINGQYTGRTAPTTLTVPPGRYTFGLGHSVDVPGSSTGEFYEETVTVGTCPQRVELTAHAPLPVKNITRIAILPIRNTIHGDANDLGVLADADIPYMTTQTNAISESWVKPYSFGLTSWNVTTLPVVENVTLQRGPDCMDAPDTGLVLEQAGLTGLRDQYDIIMFLYSSHRANGTTVAHEPCAIWAGGQEISYYTGWLRSVPAGAPSVGLFHESLHSYEWFNGSRHSFYNGVEGLHGAEEHGYFSGQNGEDDWLYWYRAFVRNQVSELDSMRDGVVLSSIPTTSDIYVGVFDTMRYGTGAVTSPNNVSAAPAAMTRPLPVKIPLHADRAPGALSAK